MSKKQVRFTAQTVVWVDIRGTYVGPGKTRADEKNIVGRFMRWLCEQKFFPARMQMSGGGQWLGAFWPEDMPVVKAWLIENGTEEIEKFPSNKS